jgi:nucleoside-diphosphate-sugar epimerase
MNSLVAGGAGFLGSHLCRALLDRGDTVICVDNLATGFIGNVTNLAVDSRFHFVVHDIVEPLEKNEHLQSLFRTFPLDRICNLASPASPRAYQRLALETLMVGSVGVKNLLDLAVDMGARILQASTSEVYGDPQIHPQLESYWGHVNPNGPRSMYDESKRFAEALCAVYVAKYKVELRTARIFNTYGPRMSPNDGRVVSTFIRQALRGDPLTIFGDGNQTRSFCFVSDQIRGQLALLESDVSGPVNLGNPDEFTMIELAELVLKLCGSSSPIVFQPLPSDDPKQRRPDGTKASGELGWTPEIGLRAGVQRTIDWHRASGVLSELGKQQGSESDQQTNL